MKFRNCGNCHLVMSRVEWKQKKWLFNVVLYFFFCRFLSQFECVYPYIGIVRLCYIIFNEFFRCRPYYCAFSNKINTIFPIPIRIFRFKSTLNLCKCHLCVVINAIDFWFWYSLQFLLIVRSCNLSMSCAIQGRTRKISIYSHFLFSPPKFSS